MADKLISQLSATAGVVSTDSFEIEKLAGPPSEKATIAQLITTLNALYAPISGSGIYVAKAGDTMTGLLTIAQATANTSNLVMSGYSLTGANAQSMLSMAGTLNTSGVVNVINLDVTNTASGAGSNFLRFRNGGTERFSVELDGDVRSAAQIFAEAALYGGSVNIFNVGSGGRIQLTSAADGVLNILPWSGTAMLVRLAGTTSAFPALKRSGTIIQARLGDDSTFATYQGIHQVEVNATAAAPPVTTHTIPFVDAAGVTYRVPCLV